MPKRVRLRIYNLILSFRFLGGKCATGDLQPDFFSFCFGRAYRTFERDWAEFHKYGRFLGHRLEWPIVTDLFFEHLSAFGQNFISMAISLGIVWNGLLFQTYCVRAF